MKKYVISVLAYILVGNLCLAEGKTVTITHYPHPQIDQFKLLLEKSYSDIGYTASFFKVRANRGIKMLESGQADADVIRSKQHIADTENVRIVEILTRGDVSLVCLADVTCDEKVLTSGPVMVGAHPSARLYLKERFGDKLTAQFVDIIEVSQLQEMLQKHRLKHIIMISISGNLPEMFRKFSHTNLMTINGYHVINKKHEAIIPQLADAIKNNIKQALLVAD